MSRPLVPRAPALALVLCASWTAVHAQGELVRGPDEAVQGGVHAA